MHLDELRAAWAALPEPVRAAIHATLDVDATARLASASLEILGVIGERVWCVASSYEYHQAQSGSDWATHGVLFGNAVIRGDTIDAPSWETALDSNLREADTSRYYPTKVTAELIAALLTKLGVEVPPAPTETARAARCPACGATTVDTIEPGRMLCVVCGHSDTAEWTVAYERAVGDPERPTWLPPVPAGGPGFELRGDVLVHARAGFAIAIPGRAMRLPGGDDVARLYLDGAIEVTVRVASHGDLEQLIRWRSLGKPVGADGTYERYDRGEDNYFVERQWLGKRGDVAVFVQIDQVKKDFEPYAWANLTAGILATATWLPGDVPPLWPAVTAIAEPVVGRWKLLPGRGAALDEKYRRLGAVTKPQAAALDELLVATAQSPVSPAAPWSDVEPLTAAITAIMGAADAAVLAADLGDVCSMHDLRAWCHGVAKIVHNASVYRR